MWVGRWVVRVYVCKCVGVGGGGCDWSGISNMKERGAEETRREMRPNERGEPPQLSQEMREQAHIVSRFSSLGCQCTA